MEPDVWVCKEKVTLTYSLLHNVKELDQTQPKVFYRQIESILKDIQRSNSINSNHCDDEAA